MRTWGADDSDGSSDESDGDDVNDCHDGVTLRDFDSAEESWEYAYCSHKPQLFATLCFHFVRFGTHSLWGTLGEMFLSYFELFSFDLCDVWRVAMAWGCPQCPILVPSLSRGVKKIQMGILFFSVVRRPKTSNFSDLLLEVLKPSLCLRFQEGHKIKSRKSSFFLFQLSWTCYL